MLLVGSERLDQGGWDRMIAGLEVGDPGGETAAGWLAKELLRRVYAAGSTGEAWGGLQAFYDHCSDRRIPELVTLARTVRSWQAQVLAYHTTGASNGPTEAVNLLIEKTRRIGHGFRNFQHYRLRLLLQCGGVCHHRPTRRIRGRQPRLLA